MKDYYLGTERKSGFYIKKKKKRNQRKRRKKRNRKEKEILTYKQSLKTSLMEWSSLIGSSTNSEGGNSMKEKNTV